MLFSSLLPKEKDRSVISFLDDLIVFGINASHTIKVVHNVNKLGKEDEEEIRSIRIGFITSRDVMGARKKSKFVNPLGVKTGKGSGFRLY